MKIQTGSGEFSGTDKALKVLSKPVSEMTDEELLEEIKKLQALRNTGPSSGTKTPRARKTAAAPSSGVGKLKKKG